MIIIDKIELFKRRQIKAKSLFSIFELDKKPAYDFVARYHYLKDAKFFAKYCYGLFVGSELVGVSTFSNPQGIVSMKSWFGLNNDNQDVLEISRLCMLPSLNGSNATSYLLGNSIKLLAKKKVKAVISLADDSKHVGSIYQVCNFKYYGLTDKKSDFYAADGRVNPRGPTKDVQGVWLPRTQKHRYCYMLDDGLNILLTEQPKPTIGAVKSYDCCGGSDKVYDSRYNKWYTCPRCTNRINIIADDEIVVKTNNYNHKMNKLIKKEWIRRILLQHGLPEEQKKSPEYLLNQMYEEMTGDKIRYPNKHQVKDETGKVKLYLSFGNGEPIHEKTHAWAGLPPERDPCLPSWIEIGGCTFTKPYCTLNWIRNIGLIRDPKDKSTIFEKDKKVPSRRANMKDIAYLIDKDL